MPPRAPAGDSPGARRRRAPTLQDLAAKVGVSTATVSRAFSHPFLLREETVKSILDAAAELGYSPNGAGRALARGRFDLLAMVVPDLSNVGYPPLIKAVQNRARELELAVLLGESGGSSEREYALLSRLAGQVDGLVISETSLSDQVLEEFGSTRATVLIDAEVHDLSRVISDVRPAMEQALHYLSRLGHRRLLYLTARDSSWIARERSSAVDALSRKFELKTERRVLDASSLASGRAAADVLIGSEATAVLVSDDVIGNGLLVGLRAKGMLVPRDFSVISCQDVWSAQLDVPLTAIAAPVAAMGKAVVDLMRRVESDAKLPAERVVIRSELKHRDSTGVVSTHRSGAR